MEVEFRSGAVYRYYGVSAYTASLVVSGHIDGSVGRTFHRLVRQQRYRTTRIQPSGRRT